MSQELFIVQLILAAIASVVAVCSAVIAVRAIGNARSVAEAQILIRFREKYTDDQMLDDLRLLASWRGQHQEDFAQVWYTLFIAKDPDALKVDRARRRVGQYFYWISDLYAGGFISRKMTELLLNVSGFELFFSIVLPLDAFLDHGFLTNRSKTLEVFRKARPL